jgi:hypothetical protein
VRSGAPFPTAAETAEGAPATAAAAFRNRAMPPSRPKIRRAKSAARSHGCGVGSDARPPTVRVETVDPVSDTAKRTIRPEELGVRRPGLPR